MMNETTVFLNTWYHYNNGSIGFGWMTTQEAREFMESKEGITEFEEWFIADIDNYLGIEFENLNYSNVDTILETIETLEDMDEDERNEIIAIMEYRNCDIAEAIENKNSYLIYSDIDEYHNCCDELIECMLSGDSKSRQSSLDFFSRYFDYEAYYRDCDFDIYEASNGVVIQE